MQFISFNRLFGEPAATALAFLAEDVANVPSNHASEVEFFALSFQFFIGNIRNSMFKCTQFCSHHKGNFCLWTLFGNGHCIVGRTL